jgi:lysophospholipase L1-like esterase
MSTIIKPFVTECETLSSGEELKLISSAVKTRKHLTFTADVESLGGAKLLVGHGYKVSCASWVQITEKDVSAFSYYSWTNPNEYQNLKDTEHGITISDFITVNIDHNQSGEGTVLTVMSSGGMFRININGWSGVAGDIFASIEGATLKNCRLSWYSDDFARKIWIIGDSYLGTTYGARWPYYVFKNGYDNAMFVGISGMNTQRGLIELKTIIDKGNPEFIVWCMGMNNGDPKDQDEVVEENYKKATEEFLAICKERGITPILSTIPNTPVVHNMAKNKWVRSLPYRYIDFSRAVGSDKMKEWYPGMLFKDNVHPDERGGAALYMQVLVDFPEIMQRV